MSSCKWIILGGKLCDVNSDAETRSVMRLLRLDGRDSSRDRGVGMRCRATRVVFWAPSSRMVVCCCGGASSLGNWICRHDTFSWLSHSITWEGYADDRDRHVGIKSSRTIETSKYRMEQILNMTFFVSALHRALMWSRDDSCWLHFLVEMIVDDMGDVCHGG
jgi:hypothetical protein